MNLVSKDIVYQLILDSVINAHPDLCATCPELIMDETERDYKNFITDMEGDPWQ